MVFVTPILILVGLAVLVFIGIFIIFTVGALIFLLPAFILAAAVWWITRNELWAGITFLVVALFSLMRRRD